MPENKARFIKKFLHDMLSDECTNIVNELKHYNRVVKIDDWYTYDMLVSKSGGQNEMSNYFWINIECRINGGGNQIAEENYVITMLQQDIDLNTGNCHMHLDGKIQVWRNLVKFKGCEKGGEIRVKPTKIEDISVYEKFRCKNTEG